MVLEYFSPATGFSGGALIGLAAAALLILSGEVLGASGIASSILLRPKKSMTDPSTAWKMIFLSFFLLLSNLALAPFFTNDQRLGTDPSIPVVSIYGYVLGGLFVGFGTRMGNGCTTGHGICGMARLSVRSIVAVATFMASAFATALIVAPDNQTFANGTARLRTDNVPVLHNAWLGLGVSLIIVAPTLYAIYNLFFGRSKGPEAITGDDKRDNKDVQSDKDLDALEEFGGALDNGETEASNSSNEVETASKSGENEQTDNVHKVFPAVLASSLFATGLAVSGMVLPSKISGFLNLFTIVQGSYDPTLLTVMIGGCIVSMISYQFVRPFSLILSADSSSPPALDRPLLVRKFCIPCSRKVDAQLVGGALCFGIGWGLANLCPGPAMFLFASGCKPVIVGWWPAYIAGAFLAQWMKTRKESEVASTN